MSTAVLPSLAGLGFEVIRTPMFKNLVQENVSGKETRVALWSYPRWQWDLTYNVIRQGTVHGTAYTEFAQLAGFFNQRQGRFDTFQYQDADDNSVTAQAIGTGDGSRTAFQLIRGFGGFVEPVLAPNTVSKVYLNGVEQVSGWSVSNWGSSSPGVITFSSAPGNGVAITADFSYYFPCRFTEDQVSFSMFMKSLYAGKKVSFLSVKN